MSDSANNVILLTRDLRKTYFSSGGEVEVLRGVSIGVSRGEIVAIVGPSGVGKSTLLNLIGALDRPSSGEVLINGEDLFSKNDDELAEFRNSTIGFIFQFHHLLPELSAFENVMLPALLAGKPKEMIHERTTSLLNDVGLSKRGSHKPSELSGGERQRVAIARAIVNDPKLILADEPTGNLDRENAEEMYELIWKLREENQQTFLIVTHNEELANKTDRIIRLVDGYIKE
ncbi:MAG: ABC transporter ATP-binding protein [Candidatus Marinimicrobia bacterium]|nr:ABC transporter ATP-binding protein [Candidatus Neomarinimicrobiota bacterium]